MLFKVVDLILVLVFVLVNVAFITLMERKILGYCQMRLGPNKPSYAGLLQPMADAVKLFTNKSTMTSLAYSNYFPLMPFLSLCLVLLIWPLMPGTSHSMSFSFGLILLLVLFGFSVYPVLLAGWSSNSKFSSLGAIRNVAQTISYEVSMAILISILLISLTSLSISEITSPYITLYIFPGILMIWLIIAVAETNRTPFDFAEGESELVSGFNTEYSSSKFAAVFMAEYASIYFMSCFSAVMFISGLSIYSAALTVSFILFWVWLRATLPRHRYDYLMELNWKKMLPLITLFLFFSCLIYLIYNKI